MQIDSALEFYRAGEPDALRDYEMAPSGLGKFVDSVLNDVCVERGAVTHGSAFGKADTPVRDGERLNLAQFDRHIGIIGVVFGRGNERSGEKEKSKCR